MNPGATLIERLARLACGSLAAPLDDAVLHHGRRAWVDWLACALAGLEAPSTRILLDATDDTPGGIALPGLPGRRIDPHFAALALGNAGHALDYDDTDHVNLIHVSSTVFPALLALAPSRPIDGARFLRIYIAAHELEDRIGAFLGRRLTAHGWHVSGVVGHLGAAFAAAAARGLDEARIAQAIAIASTGASGLIGAFGTMAKHLQLGRAAAAGVLAARLAERGYDGPLAVLESDPGFCQSFVRERDPAMASLEQEWGEPYAVTRNSFKPHASCLITHPIVDAGTALGATLRSEGVDPASVARIECRVNPLAPKVAGIPLPRTGLEGKFSVAYCADIGLLDGRATPDRFAPEAVERPAVRTMLARTQVITDDAIGEQQAELEVRTADGRGFTQRIAMAKGNPANALTDADLAAKFRGAAAARLGDRTDAVLAGLWRFDDEPDVGRWIDTLNQSPA